VFQFPTSRSLVLSTLVSLSLVACHPTDSSTTPSADSGVIKQEHVAKKKIRVPGFDGGGAWFNTTRPLTRDDLRGKIVVVDFWTSCCINCLQTLPTLRNLEHEFANDPVVVIGVHSPKFEAETQAPRLASILAEHDIQHPVVLDDRMAIWNQWGVRAWPTVVVLGPEQEILWVDTGEPDPKELSAAVRKALTEARKDNLLVQAPIKAIQPQLKSTGSLRFPGKILALKNGGVAVSDTGHHRVVVLDQEGNVQKVFGTGVPGLHDGAAAEATFRFPQGIAQDGDRLLVADTENHAIREINLKTEQVRTIAGTGQLGHGFLNDQASQATKLSLRSPWDILIHQSKAYIALAGSHQVARLDLHSGTIALFAGSGRESLRNGTADQAAFAQPSALATNGKELFVLDSETSSIRAIHFQTQITRTLVGKGLFDFGDVDGQANQVRLQHPLGMTFAHGKLWVADTYNSKIKEVDPISGKTKTLLGGADNQALFEPGGLSSDQQGLWVADTHHHRLLSIPWANSHEKVIEIKGLQAPVAWVQAHRTPETGRRELPADGTRVVIFRLPAARKSELSLNWNLPDGTGINDEAPFRITWVSQSGLEHLPTAVRMTGKQAQAGVKIAVEPSKNSDKSAVHAWLDLVLCDIKTHRICKPVHLKLDMNMQIGSNVQPQLQASVALPEAKVHD
jgi:thiol-disulfide isomerase/thioredoxin